MSQITSRHRKLNPQTRSNFSSCWILFLLILFLSFPPKKPQRIHNTRHFIQTNLKPPQSLDYSTKHWDDYLAAGVFFFFQLLDLFVCSSQFEQVDVFKNVKANSTCFSRRWAAASKPIRTDEKTSHAPACETAFMGGKQILKPHFSPCMCNNHIKLTSLF